MNGCSLPESGYMDSVYPCQEPAAGEGGWISVMSLDEHARKTWSNHTLTSRPLVNRGLGHLHLSHHRRLWVHQSAKFSPLIFLWIKCSCRKSVRSWLSKPGLNLSIITIKAYSRFWEEWHFNGNILISWFWSFWGRPFQNPQLQRPLWFEVWEIRTFPESWRQCFFVHNWKLL